MSIPSLLVVLALAGNPCDPGQTTTLLEKALRVVGLDATTKGPGEAPPAGDLFAVSASGGSPQKRLTDGHKLRSPLFTDNDHVVALEGNRLVRVDLSGDLTEAPDHVTDLPGAVRLAGWVDGEPDLLVALVEKEGRQQAAVVCLGSGRVTPLDQVEASSDLAKKLDHLLPRLRRAERRYGDVLLRDQENPDGGRDVVQVDEKQTVALSQCGKDACTQGALSPDRKVVVFVKTPSRFP